MLYQTNLHRSSFRGSNVLSCLQRLTLESGFALALVAISFIISVSVARESNIGLCFSYFFGNVYALSLLAMLNARAHFTWPIGSAARGATAAATAPEENGTSTCPAHTHSAPQTVSRVHTGTSRASALGQDISAGPSRASSRRRVERSIRRDEPAVPRPDSLRLPEAPYQRSIRRLSGEEDERGQSSCFRAFPPSAADEDVGSRGWRQDERPAGLVNNVFASPHFVGGQSLSEIELEEVAPGTTPRGIGDFPSGLVASASGFVEAGEPVDHDAGMRAAMAEGLEEVDFSDHSFSSNGRIPSGLVAGVPSELDSQSWHLHDESSSVDSEDLAPRRATL